MHIAVFLIQSASFIHLVCRYVILCLPLLPCLSKWHGSLPEHGLWQLTCKLYCSPLVWRLWSVYQLWKSPLFSGHMLQGYWRDVLCRVKPLGQGSSTSWARAPSPSVEDTLVPALSAGQSPLQHTMHLPPIGGALSVGLHVIFGTVEIVFGRPIATFYNDNFRTS